LIGGISELCQEEKVRYGTSYEVIMINPFSMKGRLNRAKYLLILVILYMLVNITIYIGAYIIIKLKGEISKTEFDIVSILSTVVWFVLGAFPTVRRYHDIDQPGSHFWLLLIPAYNIVVFLFLLFTKGTDGPNKYGEETHWLRKQMPRKFEMKRKYLHIIVIAGVIGSGIWFAVRDLSRDWSNEAKFKSVDLGMTENEVIRIMGTPQWTITKPGTDSGEDLPALKEGERDLFWHTMSQRALGVRISSNGKIIYVIKEQLIVKPK
jgi:uncharacterized membrane protein YhaH (DUF805 family)